MTVGELWRGLRHLIRGSSAAADLRDEMALHVELRARANSMAGMSHSDAHSAARRTFGNQPALRDRSRDQWGFNWAEQLARDVRYAVRRLIQRPAFSVAVIGVLTLGIGATTAMFSAVDAAMLRPLPFADPARLVALRRVNPPWDMGPGQPRSDGAHSVDLVDVQQMRGVFSGVAAYAAGGLNLADADRPSRVKAGVVTTDFFSTLGVRPIRGRAFVPVEGVPNGPHVAVLSYGLWHGQFGEADIVGKSITLNDQAYTVVGIMPRGFGFPEASDLWIPMSVPVTFATFGAFKGFLPSSVIARLGPGVSAAVAGARLMARWEEAASSPAPDAGRKYAWQQMVPELRATGTLVPLQRELTGDRRAALLVVLGATLLLLLVTCANVTALLLSQAAARRHEIAVRAVLGASRARIVAQLLVESVVLAVAGTAFGAAIAPAALGAMRSLMPAQLSGVAPATVDLRVLGFAAGLALLTGIGFGLWPALGATRDAPAETIKAGGRGATGRHAGRARRALVGVELALTIVLLVGSLLMLRSFARLLALDRGMKTERVGTLELAFGTSAGDRSARLRTIDAIVERVSAISGVTAAGAINDLPLGGSGGVSVMMKPDVGQPPGGDAAGGRYLMASGGYFAAMGIPVKRGRTFTAADDSLAPPVAVISETMGRMFWPGVDAVGHTFTMFSAAPITVVGVVADVRERKLESDPMPQMYFPVAEQTPSSVAIVVRGTLEPAVLQARMKEVVHSVDPSQAVFNVRSMDDVVGASVAPRRTNTLLISAFAFLALALSALGMYAVVSNTVAQRAREFGIRSALGASDGALLRLVTGEMGWVCAAGLSVGVGGAWALAKLLTSMIYGVSIHDPWTFALAPLVLLVPAALAAVIPARRASRVSPAEVMRTD